MSEANERLANRTQQRVLCVGVVRQTKSAWLIYAWNEKLRVLLFLFVLSKCGLCSTGKASSLSSGNEFAFSTEGLVFSLLADEIRRIFSGLLFFEGICVAQE